MSIGAERAAVQNPFLRYVGEAGWTVVSREEALDLRWGITSPVLDIEQLTTGQVWIAFKEGGVK